MTPITTSHSNVDMPAIIYGTAWKKERTADLVEQAIELGFRGVDTACQPKHYFESGVGEGLKRAFEKGISRDEVFVQTKFTGVQGQDPRQIPYDPKESITHQVEKSVQVSLHNLGLEKIDSLVLHGPLSTWEQTMEAWRGLEKAQSLGFTRQIGLSNCYDSEMFLALLEEAQVKPAVLQNRFYQDTGYDQFLRRICAEHDIVYQCFWTLTANPQILESRLVCELANKYTKTPEQVFFRFVHELGIQILTGTTSPKHMKEDLEIFDFKLEKQDIQSIEKVLYQ